MRIEDATAAAEVESDHDDPRHDLGADTRLREDAPADAAPTKKAKPVKTVGDANVTNVFAREEGDGTWTFHVTVEHADVNWYDYADGWDIVLPDGTVLMPDPFGQYTPCSSSAR